MVILCYIHSLFLLSDKRSLDFSSIGRDRTLQSYSVRRGSTRSLCIVAGYWSSGLNRTQKTFSLHEYAVTELAPANTCSYHERCSNMFSQIISSHIATRYYVNNVYQCLLIYICISEIFGSFRCSMLF